MRVCCCTLAGTSACRHCSNGTTHLDNEFIRKIITTNDSFINNVKNGLEEIEEIMDSEEKNKIVIEDINEYLCNFIDFLISKKIIFDETFQSDDDYLKLKEYIEEFKKDSSTYFSNTYCVIKKIWKDNEWK